VCERLGLPPFKLLKAAADVGCQFAMCVAQIIAAVSHPAVVEKTIDCALTDKGFADRVVLHKAMGFLPMPKGSQTAISVTQNAQASARVEPIVAAPRPEETIRRLVNAFNEKRCLSAMPRTAMPEASGGQSRPARSVFEDATAMSPEGPEDEEGDGW
jgi:hypothetical protein